MGAEDVVSVISISQYLVRGLILSRAEQALGADSPSACLFGKLRGRAAQAQRWIALLVLPRVFAKLSYNR
jgi:hypothetical protein